MSASDSMADKVDAVLGEMSSAIRAVFQSTERGLLDKVADLENERDRLLDENIELRRMYDELTEKYTRVKLGLRKALQRRKSEPDVDQMATMFMESSSTFEDAARAAIRAKSISKRFKATTGDNDVGSKNTKNNSKETPVVNRVRSMVSGPVPEPECQQDPSLSPKLGGSLYSCHSTTREGLSTVSDKQLDNAAGGQSPKRIPVRNSTKEKSASGRNEFNTVRCGVAPSELKGYAYDCCKEFYEQVGIDHVSSHNCKKSLVDAVSRHRSSRPMPNTPEGFWNIQLPETQE